MTAPTRNPHEALPLAPATLDYMPAELRQQYARQIDGTWRLAWVNESDGVSRLTHEDYIIAGKLDVLPDGETPATIASRQERQTELNNATLRELAKLDEEEKATRLKAIEAKQKAQQKVFDAEAERIRNSYGR